MAQQWQFKQDEHQRWRWTHVELRGEPIASVDSFESRIFCVLDAIRYTMHRHRSKPPISVEDASRSRTLNRAPDA
jgi:hypothetical protein